MFKFPSELTSGLVEIKWLKLGKMSILIKNSGHVGAFIELKKSEAKSDDEMVKVNNQDPWASKVGNRHCLETSGFVDFS